MALAPHHRHKLSMLRYDTSSFQICLDPFRESSLVFRSMPNSKLEGSKGAQWLCTKVLKSIAQVPVSKLRRLLNHDVRLPALVGLVAPGESCTRVGMVEFTTWSSYPHKCDAHTIFFPRQGSNSSTNITFWPWSANHSQLCRCCKTLATFFQIDFNYTVFNIHPGSKNCQSLNTTRWNPIDKFI